MTPEQTLASNPTASVFVSASAGSGKTSVLINRLLRLMLPHRDTQGNLQLGCHPNQILCLTFTNAAATEMTTRLQKELGKWATFSDDDLNKKLEALEIPLSPETRNKARSLFTKVLDLPGGMRIGTIHAFCQSLLRRFPIEANLSPQFTLLDENDAETTLALQQCIEDTLGQIPRNIIDPLVNKISLGTFTERVLSLCRNIKAQPILELANDHPHKITHILCEALNIPIPQTDDAILEQACRTIQEEALRQSFYDLAEKGTDKAKKRIQSLQQWLNLPLIERKALWENVWCKGLVTNDGTLQKNLISKKIKEECPDIIPILEDEAKHIRNVKEQRTFRHLLAFSESFIRSIAPIAQRYNNQKAYQGQLEYDDLIRHTRHLLEHVETSWVLYKLDSKIDHILIDEAQDTSPEQWEIIQHLTNEFFAGIGARSEKTPHRTIFAVGDYKQSIYSFQGAEPQAFKDWQNHFHQCVKNAQLLWDTPQLETSFRSAPIVLKFVDTVFSFPEAAQGVRREQETVRHEAFPKRVGCTKPRIELWPLAFSDVVEDKEIDPWNLDKSVSSQRPGKKAEQKLADTLADYIKQLIQPSQSYSSSLKPQDILILVRKRSPFVAYLFYALKRKNVPVTNLTRARLTDQIAVQDLMTLCEALLLPQDDLTLACVLTSPLGGLSDESLMRLAVDRPNNQDLWSTLKERHSQEEDWTRAWNFLDTLFSKVDYLSPYALLSLALGPLSGQARLLARLGQNAIEPIDELLTTALQYQDKNPPSLQSFIHWLKNAQKEIKYKAGTEGQSVRIMTVHSAKGLESPLVILPDTMSTPDSNKRDTLRWVAYPCMTSSEINGLKIPVYASKNEAQLLPKIQEVINTQKIKEQEEYNRLLYVALTRARDRLVICGFNSEKKKTEVSDTSWYYHCKRAFQELGAQRRIGFNGAPDWLDSIDVLEENNVSQESDQEESTHVPSLPSPLPSWIGHAPDWVPTLPEQEESSLRTLTPSRSENDSSTSSSYAYSPLEIATITPIRARTAALQRGTLVHELLQFLSNLPADKQESVARQYLERPIHGFERDTAHSLAKSLISVIRMPDLAPLFTQEAKAEQPLAGIVNGQVIVGQVDRLCILPDRAIVCDFKTGRHVPHNLEATPVAYLRQMAIYRTLLQQLWPNKTIICVLIWIDATDGPRADILPETLLNVYSP